eukprot:CAMPEP_0172056880 /NCGR_PEP_ID=MMETSP1043-20130122/6039_1 /TAXON_ID=464988 /ORGANISM="Hemiselmis andersenii, Strain CCMP441" /LENGTH=519 /DNA_ID=CAMNT_0012716353 /DNA_START=190 /DNA_END=1746 /DNA_ORIENTATION=-
MPTFALCPPSRGPPQLGGRSRSDSVALGPAPSRRPPIAPHHVERQQQQQQQHGGSSLDTLLSAPLNTTSLDPSDLGASEAAYEEQRRRDAELRAARRMSQPNLPPPAPALAEYLDRTGSKDSPHPGHDATASANSNGGWAAAAAAPGRGGYQYRRPNAGGAGGVHPIVAVLRGMRNKSADNMVYAMAMSKKLEQKQREEDEKEEEEEKERARKEAEETKRVNKVARMGVDGQPSPERVVSVSAPEAPKREALGTVDTTYLYNCLVDGTAGHVIVDTRSEEVYREGHVRRSLRVGEAVQYKGKHFLLVSGEGEMFGREWQAVDELEKGEGALSIRLVRGGYGQFSAEYAFLCEDQLPAGVAGQRERQRQQYRTFLPSRVNEHLFIGGKECAEDADTVHHLGITRILSILQDPQGVKVPSGTMQLCVPLEDEPDVDITAVFDECYRFMQTAVSAGQRVLVHCKMGKSRSATILVMFAMRFYGMSLRDAHAMLKGARRQVHMNSGFSRQIQAYEKVLFGEGG